MACEVNDPRARIRKLIEAVHASLQANGDLQEQAPNVFAAIRYSCELYERTFT